MDLEKSNARGEDAGAGTTKKSVNNGSDYTELAPEKIAERVCSIYPEYPLPERWDHFTPEARDARREAECEAYARKLALVDLLPVTSAAAHAFTGECAKRPHHVSVWECARLLRDAGMEIDLPEIEGVYAAESERRQAEARARDEAERPEREARERKEREEREARRHAAQREVVEYLKASSGRSIDQLETIAGKRFGVAFGVDIVGAAREAYQYKVAAAMAQQPAVARTEIAQKRSLSFTLAGDIKPNTDQVWLVQDVLPIGGLALLYAKPNTGKTFVALDLAFAIGRGVPWLEGYATEAGAVLYVAIEGSLANRVTAYRVHNGVGSAPVAVVQDTIDLLNPKADVHGLVDAVRQLEAASGVPVRLVVLDTLARALSGGDENAARDMGGLLANVNALQKTTGAAVLLVHHLGKDDSRGARGHSSLLAAVDTALEIREGVVHLVKQRDAEIGARIGFALRAVRIGADRQGRALTSCVVERAGVTEVAFEREAPSGRAGHALRLLNELLLDEGAAVPSVAGDRPCVQSARWLEVCKEKLPGGSPAANERAYERAVKRLTSTGHVVVHGGLVWTA